MLCGLLSAVLCILFLIGRYGKGRKKKKIYHPPTRKHTHTGSPLTNTRIRMPTFSKRNIDSTRRTFKFLLSGCIQRSDAVPLIMLILHACDNLLARLILVCFDSCLIMRVCLFTKWLLFQTKYIQFLLLTISEKFWIDAFIPKYFDSGTLYMLRSARYVVYKFTLRNSWPKRPVQNDIRYYCPGSGQTKETASTVTGFVC